MACEKQFLPPDDSFLYCSEAYVDPLPPPLPPTNTSLTRECNNTRNKALTHHSCREYDATASHRPSPSNPPTDYHTLYVPRDPRPIIPRASPSRPSSTCPQPTYHQPTYPAPPDAITALRSLTVRPVSPGGAWPFGSGAGGGGYSATYDGAYGKESYGYANGSGKYASSAERPLPKRRPGYSGGKGAELVTPLVGL